MTARPKRSTELHVKLINADGDAFDTIHYSPRGMAQATRDAETLVGYNGIAASVVERVRFADYAPSDRHPEGDSDVDAQHVASFGDPAALAAGGWPE